MLVRAVIDGVPIPKGRPRVFHHDRNGRELARPRTVTPARTMQAEEMIRWAILGQNPGLVPTEELVEMRLWFTGAKRGDIDNLIKTVLDAGNGVIWKDDDQVRGLNATLDRKGEPQTKLLVMSLPDGLEVP